MLQKTKVVKMKNEISKIAIFRKLSMNFNLILEVHYLTFSN